MIKITNLTYTYPQSERPALQDVNWRAMAGDFVLLAGASGSGKSTLLRCLNGLVPHFSGGTVQGKISVNGLDVVAAGPGTMSHQVGFVQQNPEAQAVVEQVEAEIAFGLENQAIPPQAMRIQVEEVLELLELTMLRERPLSTLSGGERQRVAIASALALRPPLLVLDEPTSQLDPQSAEEVLRALVRLNEDLGLTIVLAEHRLERILPYVDHILYLENGRVIVDGAAREVVDQIPQLPPVADLGRKLGWQPLPLTVKEARRFSSQYSVNLEDGRRKTEDGKDSPSSVLRPPSPLLEAKGVSFAYNGCPTLLGVDLQVAPGEAVAVMGRNGAGKSTLLKCMVGLLSPAEGEVWVNGRSTHKREVADICREVGYLPQNPDDLLFADTVADELQFTLNNHGLNHNGVHRLLGELGLGQVTDAYPRDLSVGQRQRVALGAVTITHPRLLLLDEPTRGLDYAAKQDLVAIWRRWLAAGMGLLLVTHDVELVAQIADRVAILSQGEIIAAGKTADILSATPLFAPQIARLFPNRGWLTVQDVAF